MAQLKTTMDIFKLLDQSNCRECHEKTCLAFAAAVFKGKRRLDECPHLDKEVIEQYAGKTQQAQSVEEDMTDAVKRLKSKITKINLRQTARRLGAGFADDKLTIKVFGKDFSVDAKGNLSSDIHINPWIAIPVLNYIIDGAGTPVLEKWMPFRELKNGKVRHNLYLRRCEAPLKLIADTYTDFFKDLLDIFNGKKVKHLYDADISIVLYPLPLVPIVICYWKPEDGLESSLHLFFDATAEDNLDIESLYTLTVGFVTMFQKIASRHVGS